MPASCERSLRLYVHTLPGHFENGENVTVAKFELAFTRYRNYLKTVRNLTVNNSLQDFDAKEMYSRPQINDGFCSKSVEKFLFSSFSSVHTMQFPKCAG